MGKYLETGKISMKNQVAYRFDVFVRSILPFIRLFLAYALWKALYAGQSVIGGMSFEMMITYYLIVSFLLRLDQSSGLVWETAEEIREGRFSKYMVRPISLLGHFLAASLAKTLYVLKQHLCIHSQGIAEIATLVSLARNDTPGWTLPAISPMSLRGAQRRSNLRPPFCHCEERSDEAISDRPSVIARSAATKQSQLLLGSPRGIEEIATPCFAWLPMPSLIALHDVFHRKCA